MPYSWPITVRTSRGSGLLESGLPKDQSTYIYGNVPQARLALYSAGYYIDARESLCSRDKNISLFHKVRIGSGVYPGSYSMFTVTSVSFLWG